MDIKSLGPMLVVPGDEELDKELERRRIQDEKARAGPVTTSEMGQGGPGSATDDDQGGAALRLEEFLERLRKGKDQTQNEAVTPPKVESLEAFGKRKDQIRQKAIGAYRHQLEFDQTLGMKGLQYQKKVG